MRLPRRWGYGKAMKVRGGGMLSNYDLREDIREYWSNRAETFDLAFGHRIAPGHETEAWQKPIRDHLGDKPLKILELACGTGEVTRIIHDLGHTVTALDFSEEMLAKACAKHRGKERLSFLLADGGNTMEPDESYDAIICRHFVWTLTEPETAFADWLRILRPGGRLLVFDGDWSAPKPSGRWAARAVALIDRLIGPDNHYDSAMSERHADIMQRLPFGDGLTAKKLIPLINAAGFTKIAVHSHAPIAAAMRRSASLRNRLRTFIYSRFILTAQKPRVAP